MNLRMDSEGSSRTVLLECERQQGRQAVSLSGCQEEGDGKAEEKATPFAMEVASSWMEGGALERAGKPRGLERAGLGLSQYPQEKVPEKEEACFSLLGLELRAARSCFLGRARAPSP